MDACPAGWPRPRVDGRPVPWVTPVLHGQPWWKFLHLERLRRCQEEWLCQVCGLTLPTRAQVIADAQGHLVTDGALHRRCLRLALTVCPGLANAEEELLVATVGRRDLLVDGQELSDEALSAPQAWDLTASALAVAIPVGDFHAWSGSA
ncbi:hypothetical protein Misp03_37540 [Microbispora sp. NBRC 16548]|nr:hypothetical protein Misp03_37540 [Microbispora sp. NBRC 16548]